MFAAVAATSVNRISLMAQQDANEKLVKQAEQHRELMEKELTANLARIREEHQKTIDETIRIRDECAQLYEKANDLGEDYLQKVEEHQGGELVRMQLEFMRKRADRYAQEIRDNAERHEQELAQKKALTASKDKDLARERLKIKELQTEIREFEESLLGLKTSKIREEILDDKEEAPPKKIKMEVEGTIRAVAVPTVVVPAYVVPQASVLPQTREQGSPIASSNSDGTKTYSLTVQQQKAFGIIMEAARSTVTKKSVPQAVGAAVVVPSAKERVITNVADNEVRTSAYTTSDRHKKALDVVTKKETPIRPPQEQSSSQDVYAATPQQITQALKLWKDRLIKSGDYVPLQHRSHKAYIEKIRILRGAMTDYTSFNPVGSQALTFNHGKFGPLQREYHIPLFYCEPEK